MVAAHGLVIGPGPSILHSAGEVMLNIWASVVAQMSDDVAASRSIAFPDLLTVKTVVMFWLCVGLLQMS